MNALETIQLTPDELSYLDLLLRQEHESLRVELHHAMSHNYKDRVHERETVVRSLLEKVERIAPAPSAAR